MSFVDADISRPAPSQSQADAVVIGGGPAGLMAAQVLAQAGRRVQLFDAMPSVGRKFLLAGKGGLNLTHSEDFAPFMSRYGAQSAQLLPYLQAFDAQALRAWAADLGIATFVGSSGRVFPQDLKAAPLLRAWLQQLRGLGVSFRMRQRWQGWTPQGALRFATAGGECLVQPRAVVLALGGASWPRLGSDAAWLPWLAERGVATTALAPANCGFDVPRLEALPNACHEPTRRAFFAQLLGSAPAQPLAVGWSDFFVQRFAGQPFKSVALTFNDSQGRSFQRRGEFVSTATGVEGSLIYAVSSLLRDEIAAQGFATFYLDLLPNHSLERVLAEVQRPRGARSWPSHLKSRLGLDGIQAAILVEQLGKAAMHPGLALAQAIKALPITVVAPRPVQEAISSAGGVAFAALDAHLLLQSCPGVFCAGEMLDWEAPTGGYLLTACFATGRAAGLGALRWLAR